jgi:hypothetical protein
MNIIAYLGLLKFMTQEPSFLPGLENFQQHIRLAENTLTVWILPQRMQGKLGECQPPKA